MSTRSITNIHEMKSFSDEEEIVCTFYRHCDGYPEAMGNDLAKYLKNKHLVNGIGANFLIGRDFNRAGTISVPLMSHIQEISGAEVMPTGSCGGDEEYLYDIFYRGNDFVIKVTEIYSRLDYEMKARYFDSDRANSVFNREQFKLR